MEFLSSLDVPYNIPKEKDVAFLTDEEGTFPNGNLQWFMDQGYQEEYIVSTEKDYCTLHLVSKKL